MTEHPSTPDDRPMPAEAPEGTPQPLADRVENRSQRPDSPAFQQFMASRWADPEPAVAEREPVAGFAARRRRRISERFPG